MSVVCHRLFWILLFWTSLNAHAAPMVHTVKVPVGKHMLVVNFSEYPPKAERSLDITLMLEGGIQNQRGQFSLRQPDGELYWDNQMLPRFPRDRRVWGLDSIALPTQGNWKLEVVVNNVGSAVLEIQVGQRPDGLPNSLIYALSSLPLLALLVLGLRAWGQVRPTRHAEAGRW
jgi:hypothetical protein